MTTASRRLRITSYRSAAQNREWTLPETWSHQNVGPHAKTILVRCVFWFRILPRTRPRDGLVHFFLDFHAIFLDRKFDVRENHSMKNATKKAAKKPAKKAAPKKKK
jgi:hypothetical protein